MKRKEATYGRETVTPRYYINTLFITLLVFVVYIGGNLGARGILPGMLYVVHFEYLFAYSKFGFKSLIDVLED